MRDFVKLLIGASEKAANISRIIRRDESLFSLLVEEKKGGEKNVRFVQDFKTLADVLIQESLRWEISKKFPEMKDNIFGEESNFFKNGIGESVIVKVEDSVEETAKLLSKVIGNQSPAANLLAEEIHRNIENELELGGEAVLNIPENDVIESYSDLGIWIDPIDGTNEYIKGSADFDIPVEEGSEERIWEGGLHCVTVLIGAFHLYTGKAIGGVVNQPFYNYTPNSNSSSEKPKWKGRVFWGTCADSALFSNLKILEKKAKKKVAILSSSEQAIIKTKLGPEFDVVYSAGAGYKLLSVILGLADVYILSKNTTHFWDTCGPHAILSSQGGGIVNFQDFIVDDQLEQLSYTVDKDSKETNPYFANLRGIIAYRDPVVFESLKTCFS